MKNSKTCQHIALQSRRLVKYASVCYIISIYVIKTLLFLHTVSPYIKYIRTFVCDQCNTIVAHILIRLLHNYYLSVVFSQVLSFSFIARTDPEISQRFPIFLYCKNTKRWRHVHKGTLLYTRVRYQSQNLMMSDMILLWPVYNPRYVLHYLWTVMMDV